MKEKLLTTREVAQILVISEEEVIELCKKGQIPHFKLAGEFLRFKKEDILRLLKEGDVFKKTVKRNRYSFREKIEDFILFNDFYIVSGIIILVLLWLIFR